MGGGVSGLDCRTFIGSTGMSTVAARFLCFHDNWPVPLRLSASEWYCVVEFPNVARLPLSPPLSPSLFSSLPPNCRDFMARNDLTCYGEGSSSPHPTSGK